MEHRQTIKDYEQRVLKIKIYIEQNLDSPLTLEEVAKIANFSPYHFHRIFHAIARESLYAYIKRLRLEKAASKLLKGQENITTIALDSGYQTPSSFGKAFSKKMKDSPSNFQKKFSSKKCYSPKGDKNMQKPNIITSKDIPVYFVREIGSYETSAQKAWQKLFSSTKKYPIQMKNARKFGMSLDNPDITEEEKLRFDACIEAKAFPRQDILATQTIKGGTFAIFEHKGPYELLSDTFTLIFKEWYPKNMENVADRPCFCEYMNMDEIHKNPQKLVTKIYVPLKK